MILFPNCKINLGLQIVNKRNDGYHDLETVFYPLPLTDILEVIHTENVANGVAFTMSGLPLEGSTPDNLCIKAWQLIKDRFPQLPSISIHLHKHIPAGAGLGGGSSDGSFTLRLLNEKFQLGLTGEQLQELALELGSDCPFFILNKPCFATGRGEILEPISLDLSAYRFIVVSPHIHISTRWAFSQITPVRPSFKDIPEDKPGPWVRTPPSPPYPLKDIGEHELEGDGKKPINHSYSLKDIVEHEPIEKWKGLLKNDFEEPVCKQYPALQVIKEELYRAGAIYASMTGSGSGFYGIFPRHQTASLHLNGNYQVFTLK